MSRNELLEAVTDMDKALEQAHKDPTVKVLEAWRTKYLARLQNGAPDLYDEYMQVYMF